jgi:hypothetical protein
VLLTAAAVVQRGGCLMLSGNRHWLEYDSVALVVLFVGIGFVSVDRVGHLKTSANLFGLQHRISSSKRGAFDDVPSGLSRDLARACGSPP